MVPYPDTSIFIIELEPFALAPLLPNLYFLSCSFSSLSSSNLVFSVSSQVPSGFKSFYTDPES
jgi:hypothetical protein